MYSIVVTAGPSLDESTQQCVHVNSETYVPISNDCFEGQVTVRVKDFHGLAPDGKEPIAQSAYFGKPAGKDQTFSIETTGVYKTEDGISGDDLMYGIVFRQSIEERLPSTYPLVVKAFQWFNPNIEFSLEGESPTMLAPLLTIMSRVTCSPIPDPDDLSSSLSQIHPKDEEDTTLLLNAQEHGSRASGALPSDAELLRSMLPSTSEYAKHEPVKGWLYGTYATPSASEARQKWFGNKDVRKETKIGSEYAITTDLANGFMDFRDHISLRMSGLPFTVKLGEYMKGRPVQYCCVSRDRKKLFWSVVFTIVDGPEDAEGGAKHH